MPRYKLQEVTGQFHPSEWVDMGAYREYMALAATAEASPLNAVTIQLRKATDSSGSGAVNHGSAVTADGRAAATALSEELGDDGSGNQYTHVSFTLSDDASPDAAYGIGVGVLARFPS